MKMPLLSQLKVPENTDVLIVVYRVIWAADTLTRDPSQTKAPRPSSSLIRKVANFLKPDYRLNFLYYVAH